MSEPEPSRLPQRVPVFTPEFLHLVDDLPETASAEEVELAGPWKVVEVAEGYEIFREWESPGEDRPLAVFAERSVAVSFLVALPAVARDFQFKAPEPADERGFAVLRDGKVVGHLQIFHHNLLQAAHVVEHQMHSPLALATLLLNAGPAAILQVGEILGRRLAGGWAPDSGR